MDLHTLIIFYGSFFSFLIVGIAIYSYLENKKSNSKINSFIKLTEKLNPIIFRALDVKYLDINHYKTRSSPLGKCVLYLFDKFLAIIRRQKFIFKFIFEPILIINGNKKNDQFDYKKYITVIPDKIVFTSYKTDELVIKFTDEKHEHFKTEIILRKPTSEQLLKFKSIENWKK